MQRIETLLQKISELAGKGERNSVIEIDLMMDYVKVMYADMLEWRNRVAFTDSLTPEKSAPAAVIEEVKIPEAPAAEPVSTAPLIPEAAAEESIPVIEEVAPVIELVKEPEQEVVAEPIPEAPRYNFPEKKDINKIIGINDKYLFISELFGNDRETYERTLAELGQFNSYDEAFEWLKENVLLGDNSEESTETVQAFYDVLHSFFSAK
jgi:hypothetical protein